MKLYKKRIFFLSLLILFIYTFFIVSLDDIYRGKEYIIETKTLIILIILAVILLIFFKKFIKLFKYKFSNTSILTILTVSILSSLYAQSRIKVDYIWEQSNTKFQNPLYDEFLRISKQHNLNLSFTKDVWVQRGPSNYKINSIFKEKPKSVDILIFGDSSICWGVIPQVIEQITKKKVQIYAYESNFLNQKSSLLFNKIAEYYLKDDGIVVYSFDNWTISKDPNEIMISKNEYNEIINWTKKDFIAYKNNYKIKLVNNSETKMFNSEIKEPWYSFDYFKNKVQYYSELLKKDYGLELKSALIYDDYIEKKINPDLYSIKNKNKRKGDMFLRWDMNTVTIYNPVKVRKSIHSDRQPDEPIGDKNIKSNAMSTSKIYGNKKVFMIPLFDNEKDYVISRNIYRSYFKDLDFDLCDLGIINPDKGYDMQYGPHMSNTGGLYKSILISYWLKNYLSRKR